MQERGQRMHIQLTGVRATGDRTGAEGKERMVVSRKAHDECCQVNQHEHEPERLQEAQAEPVQLHLSFVGSRRARGQTS